jgi:hypothetical protein
MIPVLDDLFGQLGAHALRGFRLLVGFAVGAAIVVAAGSYGLYRLL